MFNNENQAAIDNEYAIDKSFETARPAPKMSLEEHLSIRKKEEELQQQLQHMHQPSARGTVRQISENYNISKSEVRRMRADGTLEAYLQQQDAKIGF